MWLVTRDKVVHLRWVPPRQCIGIYHWRWWALVVAWVYAWGWYACTVRQITPWKGWKK